MAMSAIWKAAPPFSFLLPPFSPPPPPPSPPAPPPAPPPPMQSRGADERPTRLSLLPVVRDLDEAVPGQPGGPPPGPQSQMEWDEEEDAPPRSQNKVRQRVREVVYCRKAVVAAVAAAVAVAKTKQTAVQQVNSSDFKTPEHGPPIPTKENRKAGSVSNARIGIERRRKYELSSLRAYDELMLPAAFAQQRASLPKKNITKHQQQETSWPKKLKEKASARSLKSRASFTGLRRLGGSSLSLRQSANSPRTPCQSPAFGELTPPVPPIPMRYVEGSQESIPRPSPFSSMNMPALGADARVRPSSAKQCRETPPSQGNKSEISPFLAYENLAPASSPMTPPPRLTPSLRVPGSSTTLNTLRTSPSREFPSGPEDPFWDEAVARVKETVRRDQEEERQERKAIAKAEQKAIRNMSRDRDGHLKWAKLTIEMLSGKYDEHGWLPKKDPKDFDDEDWTFVLEVLSHKDTKALRDRLFKRPEWIEADRTHREKYEEEMRTNPTPKYLASKRAKEDKERREYGFRKILGLLTAEEMEAERHNESPTIGLGISGETEPATPLTTSTTHTSESTNHSLQSQRSYAPEHRGREVNRFEHEETPSRHKGHNHGISSVARHSVEQMTGVFNTESFNPRLSILGSEEVKQYIKKKSPIRPSPPTPTPDFSHFIASLDPRQVSGPASSPGIWLSSKHAPAERLRIGKRAASSNDLLEEYNRQQLARTGAQPNDAGESPRLPTLGIHPALRGLENATASTSHPAARSQIPRFRKAASSIAPLNSSDASGDIRRQVVDASTRSSSTTPSLQRPPKPRKPSTAVKLPSKLPATVKLPRKPASTPPSANRLSPVRELQEVGEDTDPKNAPLVRRPSTSIKSPRSAARPFSRSSSDTQLQPLSYPCTSQCVTTKSQSSAVGSYGQSPRQNVSSPLPLSYSRPSPSAEIKSQKSAMDSYTRPSPDQQPVSSPLPLNYLRHSPSSVAGSRRQPSPGGQLAFSPLPLSYSHLSPSPAVGSNSQSPPDRQAVSSPLPLSYSRPSPPAEADSYVQSTSDRQPVATPLLLNYVSSSPFASNGPYIQSPPDEQRVCSPQGLTYAILPPRPAIDSSSESPIDRQPVSSPQQLGFSDPLPSTAVIPFTTCIANNGDDKREYELFAPIPLPERLPPRSLARLSRIPAFPDASDFLAAMEEEDRVDGPHELPATPVRSPTPVRSTTPMDRLNAKRNGIPIATGSNVADYNVANTGVDRAAASSSPFNIGPLFPPATTSRQTVQNTDQINRASPSMHNVGSRFPSDSVNSESASTTGQRRESSPILNVGPYFPPGPVSFGLDQNTDQKRDAPTNSHNVSPQSPPGRLTFQPHQTTGLKGKEPIKLSHGTNRIPNNDLSPKDLAMREWRNYEEERPLVQYRGDRFENMVSPSGTHKLATAQSQGQPQHYGSHFEIMVDSSSTMCKATFEKSQGLSQHHGARFEIMADCSGTHEATTEQPHASIERCNTHLPTTPHVQDPTMAESHMELRSPSAKLSRASKGDLMSKQLRFGSSAPGRQEQSSLSPAPLSLQIPSFRSFSESNPPTTHRPSEAQEERSISFGNTQGSSQPKPNDGVMSDAGKLAKKFKSMKYSVPATAPLMQGRFEPFTPTKIRSPPADGSSTPIGTRSRLRNKFSNVFYADPIEQHETSQDQQPTSGNAGALDVNIEDVISAWEGSSPAHVQSPAPLQNRNQEIQTLRSELGLEPLRGSTEGEQKHPNHNYCWDANKIMCRRIHNQGFVLPSLPSPAPGQKVRMANVASEYFVGSPYTDESAEAQRCASCKSFCCRFAELLDHAKPTTKDIVDLNNYRQAEETIVSLRSRKPNGVEEWDSFLECSQCERNYCSKCIRLCGEVLCQQPVCMDCVESTELCPIHNVF